MHSNAQENTPQTAEEAVAPKPEKKPSRAPPAARATVPTTKTPRRANKLNPRRTVVREGSKTAQIVALLKRPGGVTAKELMKATGWQAHSVRGFLSGTVRKKMGLAVLSTKAES
jgi:Protein of unknown function (DUF3489)